jgi:organic radical activating enzyme
MLGNVCNYKCNYCFPGSNEGNIKWPDIDTVKTNLSHLLDHYTSKGRNKFELYLIGGEPTIWKDLPILTEFLKTKYNISIHISTNGSCSPAWWKRNAKFYDSIDISVHHEFAEVDHIIAVADIIYKEKINVVANVLMDPLQFEKCKAIIEGLKNSKHSWPIIAKSVHYDGITRYSDEQKTFFDRRIKRYPNLIRYTLNSSKAGPAKKVWVINEENKKQRVPNDSWFALNKLNYFSGWECNLGVEYIKIHPTGEITGNCRQHIYGTDKYFNLYDTMFVQEFAPELTSTICDKFICSCSGEIVLNKKQI